MQIKFGGCLSKEDALTIADEVTYYWEKEYDVLNNEGAKIETKLYGDQIFNRTDVYQNLFSITVSPQTINESGEIIQDGI